MKNLLLAIIICFFSIITVQAQHKKPCGTAPGKSLWLKEYLKNRDNGVTKSIDQVFIPVVVHIVKNDNGTGGFSESRVLEVLCVLKDDFAGSGVEFILDSNINSINDSGFNDHSTVLIGANKMFEYNYENAINIYFVDNPAFNCGYNLPYAGVAVAYNCAELGDHTLAHEMGHALALPHPFLGWEGGIEYDGSVPPNFSKPAPEYVTYDYTSFQSEFFTDTLIVDTAYVEKMDGSNCHFAADGFCDTKPDYLAQRWPCNGDNFSQITQLDPDSIAFTSDGSLFMSYALDNCSFMFSDEQINAMKANATTEKSEFTLLDNPNEDLDGSEVILNSPSEGELIDYRNLIFEWDELQVADYYLVQVGINPSFGIVIWDTIVTSTSVLAPELPLNFSPYSWRVKAINKSYYCTNFNESIEFEIGEVSTAEFLSINEVSVFPNLLTQGDQLQIKSGHLEGYNYEVINMAGQRVQEGIFKNKAITIDSKFESGNYVLKIQGQQFSGVVTRFVVY